MADYKAAKEAFVADNLGESIWTIQVGSLVALSAVTLYAVISRRWTGPVVDYLTTVYPLLLGVTVLSNRPWTLNGILLALAAAVYWAHPAQAPSAQGEKRSLGKWLDDSDSDEEPSQPVSAASTTTSFIHSPSSRPSPSPTPSEASPISATPSSSLSSPISLEPPDVKRTFKRRHSPTPSTSHTAINILSSPQSASFGSKGPGQSTVSSSGGTATKLPFLSVYRSHMMLMTVHCILAVDFPVFPRTQGKCETFGTSLMDVGVGSFVLSLGIVSVKSYVNKTPTHLAIAAGRALRKASPVILLGFIRVISVKMSDYPEHVSEYGVHWNFFFTLGVLPVLGAIVAPLTKHLQYIPLALVVTTIQQLLLSNFRLQDWVLSPSREGLLGANKEGLVSLPGYLAIYLFGLGLGQIIVVRGEAVPPQKSQRVSESAEEHARSRARRRRFDMAMHLLALAFTVGILLVLWRRSGVQVSRRVANAPYVLWIAAYNSTFLLGYLLIEIAFFEPGDPRAVPQLLEAVNKNGLAVFLAANLVTGLINLTTKTMYASDTRAMITLTVYSITVCALAWATRGLQLKL